MAHIIFLIINLIYFIKADLIFPLIKYDQDKNANIKLKNETIYLDITNQIYTLILIGSPIKQKVMHFITPADYIYKLTEKEYYHNFNKEYLFNQSNSISNYNQSDIYYFNKYEKNNKTDIKEIKINNFFYTRLRSGGPAINESEILLFGVLGLGVPSNKDYDIPDEDIKYRLYSFILQLKQNKAIDFYTWSIEYNKNISEDRIYANLIIGKNISDYNKSKTLVSFYADKASYLLHWSIYIDEVFIKNKKEGNILINSKMSIEINYLYDFCLGTSEYQEYIDKYYFDNLVNKTKICYKEIILLSYHPYWIYYCEQNISNYLSDFEDIFFVSKDKNFTVGLTKNDLFSNYNNSKYILFKVLFRQSNSVYPNVWIFSEIFLQKYNIIFDNDAKTINFIIDSQEGNDEESEKNRKRNLFIIRTVCEIILITGLIIIIFFLVRKIKERRKQRANELKDDNFEYVTEPEPLFNNTNSNN